MSLKTFPVLLTNDDGPPGPDSPYIWGFFRHLVARGWDVRVVIPSSQKSWIGKAFFIKEVVQGRFYYPRELDGLGETADVSRPLKQGELAEWILLDATPATCVNVALHNLFPGQIDLVISGPNLGRNSSSAFVLSSGTIGAALSSSLSGIRSVALSYGTVKRPTPKAYFDPAHVLSGRIIQRLWDSWGKDDAEFNKDEVDLYNVNVPMIEGLLSDEGLTVAWTRIWRNSYARLFKHDPSASSKTKVNPEIKPGGPDAKLDDLESNSTSPGSAVRAGCLVFKFSPEFADLIHPSSVPVGTDAWAIAEGFASVTPLCASFAEPHGLDRINYADEDADDLERNGKPWKFKL